MTNGSVSNRVIAPVAFGSFLLLLISIAPGLAFAQTASVQTAQLIPPGQNACQTVTLTSIDPHVYGGVLESFDLTISDASNGYVGILASVGNTGIPLNQITRWAGSPSGLRIHVDTPDIPVNGSVSVNVALLSSLPNQPTCLTQIAFTLNSSGSTGSASIPTYVSPSSSNSSGGTQPNSSSAGGATVPSSASKGGNAVGGSSSKSSTSSSLGAKNGTSTSALGASVAASSNMKFFGAICAGNNVYRLWFILLAIYVVIVAVVVFAEPWFLEGSVIGSTAAILVPLILLLAFWYFSQACRAASWIPVAACVIAIIGLFLAFREYETPVLLPASSDTK
jgi:hypothetical protein